MSEKKQGFDYADFSKAPRLIFEFILKILKIIAVFVIVLVVAAFTVIPAVATKDPSKIVEPIKDLKDKILG